MFKEFKTIQEQITLLRSRGLIIGDEDKAKKYLLTNNYYNIINGYSKPFLCTNYNGDDERYIDGASFDEICHLYLFDKELKKTFFDAILNVEHHLKSILSYRFAEAHQNENKNAYLDVSSFNHNQSLSITYIINSLNKIIQRNKNYENNPIYHYFHSYNGRIPIWVLIDYLDFGNLYTLMKVLPAKIKSKIAIDLISFIKANNDNINTEDIIFTPKIMLSFIKNIHEVRNICAHNNRLIYFNCRSDSNYFSLIHDKYHISRNDERKDVYSTFISMQCFISKTEYAILNNTIRKRMRKLSNYINSIPMNKILKLLGFPDNWYELPVIKE